VQRDGVLVLSEMQVVQRSSRSGALVNLHATEWRPRWRAEMPREERIARMRRARGVVKQHDVHPPTHSWPRWLNARHSDPAWTGTAIPSRKWHG
jgi:hypothetical protein